MAMAFSMSVFPLPSAHHFSNSGVPCIGIVHPNHRMILLAMVTLRPKIQLRTTPRPMMIHQYQRMSSLLQGHTESVPNRFHAWRISK